MANIRVTCPACKSELEIDASFEGQEVECGNCLEVFKAARPGPTAAPGASGTGKIPGVGPKPAGGSSGRSRPGSRPAPRSRRRDDDDDYEHDRRDDDYDDEDYGPPPPRRTGEGDGAATASLVLGILALFPGCCCGLLGAPIGISAVITGVIGLKSRNNHGQAVAGLAMGIVSLCWAVFALLAGFGNAMLNNRFN